MGSFFFFKLVSYIIIIPEADANLKIAYALKVNKPWELQAE